MLELYKAVLVIAVTFGVGQTVISYWQMKNKRKELDIIAATQFQQVYGEYKELWRIAVGPIPASGEERRRSECLRAG